MPRCFVEPAQWHQPDMVLSLEESRHLARVLRLRRGDQVMLVDGQGHTAEATLLFTRQGHVHVKVLEDTRRWEPRPSVSVTLIQAIPKHSLMDWIIQKGTELGVQAIWPILTERVIVKYSERDAQQRGRRWRTIAREAAKQSGVSWFPDIQPVLTFSEVLPRLSGFDVRLVASLHAEAKSFRETVRSLRRETQACLALMVGPEGDLTDRETMALRDAGALLVRFGPTTLRVETAALYGMSVLMHEWVG